MILFEFIREIYVWFITGIEAAKIIHHTLSAKSQYSPPSILSEV